MFSAFRASPRPPSRSCARRSSASSTPSTPRRGAGLGDVRGAERHELEQRARESRAELTSKYGFSVVAPISVISPDSTAGSSASCCALLKRWISSRNRIVFWPLAPSRSWPRRSPGGRRRSPPGRRTAPRSGPAWCGRRSAPAWSCRCRAGRRRSSSRRGRPRSPAAGRCPAPRPAAGRRTRPASPAACAAAAAPRSPAAAQPNLRKGRC